MSGSRHARVEAALRAVRAGKAYHWQTLAATLADEVERLRVSAPAAPFAPEDLTERPLRTTDTTTWQLAIEWNRKLRTGSYSRHDTEAEAREELQDTKRTDPPTRWRLVQTREIRAVLAEDGTGWDTEDEDNS
jgi:uncharacterized protein with von Willebrand factor type A (vWA) domain